MTEERPDRRDEESKYSNSDNYVIIASVAELRVAARREVMESKKKNNHIMYKNKGRLKRKYSRG